MKWEIRGLANVVLNPGKPGKPGGPRLDEHTIHTDDPPVARRLVEEHNRVVTDLERGLDELNKEILRMAEAQMKVSVHSGDAINDLTNENAVLKGKLDDLKWIGEKAAKALDPRRWMVAGDGGVATKDKAIIMAGRVDMIVQHNKDIDHFGTLVAELSQLRMELPEAAYEADRVKKGLEKELNQANLQLRTLEEENKRLRREPVPKDPPKNFAWRTGTDPATGKPGKLVQLMIGPESRYATAFTPLNAQVFADEHNRVVKELETWIANLQFDLQTSKTREAEKARVLRNKLVVMSKNAFLGGDEIRHRLQGVNKDRSLWPEMVWNFPEPLKDVVTLADAEKMKTDEPRDVVTDTEIELPRKMLEKQLTKSFTDNRTLAEKVRELQETNELLKKNQDQDLDRIRKLTDIVLQAEFKIRKEEKS